MYYTVHATPILPPTDYEAPHYATSSLLDGNITSCDSLREEHRLRVLKNRVLLKFCNPNIINQTA
jgi:hypothetical protein